LLAWGSQVISGTKINPERLISARKSKNFSRGDLAAIIGCAPQTIEKLETGQNQSTKYLLLIARALNVHEEWIVGLRNDPSPQHPANPIREQVNALLDQVPPDQLQSILDILAKVVSLTTKHTS
jgi:transcriptional regulator with XRE-family HTH domain